MYPLWQAVEPLEHYARRRRAVRLGVTPDNQPGGMIAPMVLLYGGMAVAQRVRERPIGWPVYLANRLVSAIIARRSWRRAYRG